MCKKQNKTKKQKPACALNKQIKHWLDSEEILVMHGGGIGVVWDSFLIQKH